MPLYTLSEAAEARLSAAGEWLALFLRLRLIMLVTVLAFSALILAVKVVFDGTKDLPFAAVSTVALGEGFALLNTALISFRIRPVMTLLIAAISAGVIFLLLRKSTLLLALKAWAALGLPGA